jgi:pilus assembly protein CpaB
MMRIRGLLMLVIGLFLAGGSVLVAHSYLRTLTAPSGEAVAQEIASIVVARGEIAYGAPIGPQMVRLQQWPIEAVPPEAFTSLEEVLGANGQEPRRARRSMVAGEPVLRSKVSNFGEKVTIADMIDPTKRAMAIRVNDVSGVAGFVTPGDRVDVLLTRRLDNNNMITTTVLQDIVVRGTDQLADEDLDKPNVARTVTVEVTPNEAQRVALAQEAGTLSLTLRNLATSATPDLRALSVDELTGSGPATGPKQNRAAPTVTIIRGGERSSETVRGG